MLRKIMRQRELGQLVNARSFVKDTLHYYALPAHKQIELLMKRTLCHTQVTEQQEPPSRALRTLKTKHTYNHKTFQPTSVTYRLAPPLSSDGPSPLSFSFCCSG